MLCLSIHSLYSLIKRVSPSQGIENYNFEISNILGISVASLLWRLDIVEGDVVLKIKFRMAIVSKIEAQDDEVERQHLILKSNIDIISLMSSYNNWKDIWQWEVKSPLWGDLKDYCQYKILENSGLVITNILSLVQLFGLCGSRWISEKDWMWVIV